jgi:hypothetical protein
MPHTIEVKFVGDRPTILLARKYHRQIEWIRNAKANARPQADLAATA